MRNPGLLATLFIVLLFLAPSAYSETVLTTWDVTDILIQNRTFAGSLNSLTLDVEVGSGSNFGVHGRAQIAGSALPVPAYGSAVITSGGTLLVVHITLLEYQLQFNFPGGQAVLNHIPSGTTVGNGSVRLRSVQ